MIDEKAHSDAANTESRVINAENSELAEAENGKEQAEEVEIRVKQTAYGALMTRKSALSKMHRAFKISAKAKQAKRTLRATKFALDRALRMLKLSIAENNRASAAIRSASEKAEIAKAKWSEHSRNFVDAIRRQNEERSVLLLFFLVISFQWF